MDELAGLLGEPLWALPSQDQVHSATLMPLWKCFRRSHQVAVPLRSAYLCYDYLQERQQMPEQVWLPWLRGPPQATAQRLSHHGCSQHRRSAPQGLRHRNVCPAIGSSRKSFNKYIAPALSPVRINSHLCQPPQSTPVLTRKGTCVGPVKVRF